MTMTLSDDLIRLTAPEPADLDSLYIWENDPELWPCGDTSAPLSRHQLDEYIAGYDADIFSARQLRLVIRLAATGEAVGTLDITDFNPRDRHARVGIFVAPAFRGRGIALRALSLLRPRHPHARGPHRGRQRALARPFLGGRLRHMRPHPLVSAPRALLLRHYRISNVIITI